MTSQTRSTTRFRYRAATPTGRIVSGRLVASSDAAAAAALHARNLLPIRLEAVGGGQRRVPAGRRELAVCFDGLSSLIEAGVPLERAVRTAAGACRGRLRAALDGVAEALREGRPLAASLRAAEGVFPGTVIGMVEAGERAGQLGPALARVAVHLEAEAELHARIRHALAYPLVLLLTGTASVVVITTVVVPRFAAMLADLGQQLPGSTRLLLAVVEAVRRFGLVGFGALLVSVAGLAVWQRAPANRRRLHRLVLLLPIIGPIRLRLAAGRFCSALGGMLGAGMPLLPALEAARQAAGDAAVEDAIAQAGRKVAEGSALTAALAAVGAIPDSALPLFSVGESTGRLGEMAQRAGRLANAEGERALSTAAGLLEPALVIGFGAIVAFVAAALLQAVYSIRPGGPA